jgi:hypothetical protein
VRSIAAPLQKLRLSLSLKEQNFGRRSVTSVEGV